MQTRMDIQIFSLLSKSYTQKKRLDDYVVIFTAQESININNIKVKVYKKVLKEICEKYKRVKDFIKKNLMRLLS